MRQRWGWQGWLGWGQHREHPRAHGCTQREALVGRGHSMGMGVALGSPVGSAGTGHHSCACRQSPTVGRAGELSCTDCTHMAADAHIPPRCPSLPHSLCFALQIQRSTPDLSEPSTAHPHVPNQPLGCGVALSSPPMEAERFGGSPQPRSPPGSLLSSLCRSARYPRSSAAPRSRELPFVILCLSDAWRLGR